MFDHIEFPVGDIGASRSFYAAFAFDPDGNDIEFLFRDHSVR
jgi:hypothetical protein